MQNLLIVSSPTERKDKRVALLFPFPLTQVRFTLITIVNASFFANNSLAVVGKTVHSVLFREMEERNCDSNRQIVNIAINFNTKSEGIISRGDRDCEEFSSTSLNPQTLNKKLLCRNTTRSVAQRSAAALDQAFKRLLFISTSLKAQTVYFRFQVVYPI
jgi:hypothetical protein